MIIKLALIAAFVLAACIFGCMTYKKIFEVRMERLHQAISNQVLHVAELTAVKNNYSDIIVKKKSAVGGLAKAYSIVKISCVIRIGVKNLEKSEISVSNDGKEAVIKIPRCEILDNTLISQEVFDEKKSVFIFFDTQEVFDEINRAMADHALDAERNGLVKEADSRLVEIVTATVKGFGFSNVKVKLVSTGEE